MAYLNKRNCNNCGEYYEGRGKEYCSAYCRNTDIKFRLKISKSKKGKHINILDKNPNWKGNNVGYQAIHDWLNRNFKKERCEYCEKLYQKLKGKQENLQWALRKGYKCERKRENFIVLCISCHHIYDNIGNRAWNIRRKNSNPT